eukprot:11172652-Lingulodinium_polyedra.AAC.1
MPGCLFAVVPPTFPVDAASAWNWRTTSPVDCEGSPLLFHQLLRLNWRARTADGEGLARMPRAREEGGP